MYFIALTAFERLKDKDVLNLATWIIPQVLQKWTHLRFIKLQKQLLVTLGTVITW